MAIFMKMIMKTICYIILLISQLSLSLCFYKCACNYLNIVIVLIRPGGETPCLQINVKNFPFSALCSIQCQSKVGKTISINNVILCNLNLICLFKLFLTLPLIR